MDSNPECIPYGEPVYWDHRYNKERQKVGVDHAFDWYVSFEELWPIIETFCGENNAFKVLVLGCGSSNVTEGLYDKGYTHITSIDTSAVVISHLQHRHQDKQGMEFLCADARFLSRFADNSFDLVIEKALIDSLFCGVESYMSVLKLNQEVYRVLKPSRHFISVSYGSEKARRPHFTHESLDWHVEHLLVPRRTHVHVYTMEKPLNAPEKYVPEVLGIVSESMEDERVLDEDRLTSQAKGLLRLSKIRDEEALIQAFNEGRVPREWWARESTEWIAPVALRDSKKPQRPREAHLYTPLLSTWLAA